MEKCSNGLVHTSRSGRPELRESTAPVNSCYPSPLLELSSRVVDRPEGSVEEFDRIFYKTC
jgi:hypothetical protein